MNLICAADWFTVICDAKVQFRTWYRARWEWDENVCAYRASIMFKRFILRPYICYALYHRFVLLFILHICCILYRVAMHGSELQRKSRFEIVRTSHHEMFFSMHSTKGTNLKGISVREANEGKQNRMNQSWSHVRHFQKSWSTVSNTIHTHTRNNDTFSSNCKLHMIRIYFEWCSCSVDGMS